MITGMDTANPLALDDTVYYNRMDKDSNETKALRDFHNLYVKRFLIEKTAKYLQEKMHIGKPLLIDYAVGKAGDLSKWMRGGVHFVLGIDISKDNIINSRDGACVRYLNTRKQNTDMHLRAIFLHGNSGHNILSNHKAFYTNQEKEVLKAVFGKGSAAEKPVAREYMGIARDGFHISSCQFAMHYFFQNTTSLHSFLRNLSECTHLSGYFIGTCYNGQRVFDLLQNRLEGESIVLEKNGKKIFEITRSYANTFETFPSDETSIGMPIQVYQESIDKTFEEYLVNFTYFGRLMEDYGFVSLSDAECKSIGFIHSNGSFESFFRQMERDKMNKDYGQAFSMSKEEKMISFLNQYFIYKKVRNVSPEMMKRLQDKYVREQDSNEMGEREKAIMEGKVSKSFVRKLADTIELKLDNYAPIMEETEISNLLAVSNPELVVDTEGTEGTDDTEGKEEGTEDFGEYTDFFEKLNKEVQEKIKSYPKEKQMLVLKKLQKPTKKVVSSKK
jgi:hypothetical protein